jgi:hypothetical protein
MSLPDQCRIRAELLPNRRRMDATDATWAGCASAPNRHRIAKPSRVAATGAWPMPKQHGPTQLGFGAESKPRGRDYEAAGSTECALNCSKCRRPDFEGPRAGLNQGPNQNQTGGEATPHQSGVCTAVPICWSNPPGPAPNQPRINILSGRNRNRPLPKQPRLGRVRTKAESMRCRGSIGPKRNQANAKSTRDQAESVPNGRNRGLPIRKRINVRQHRINPESENRVVATAAKRILKQSGPVPKNGASLPCRAECRAPAITMMRLRIADDLLIY